MPGNLSIKILNNNCNNNSNNNNNNNNNLQPKSTGRQCIKTALYSCTRYPDYWPKTQFCVEFCP